MNLGRATTFLTLPRLLAAPTLEHWAEALEEAQRSQADDSHAGSQAQAPEPEQKTQKVAHAV